MYSISFLQEYVSLLMPPLIEKWNQLKDEDKDLFPLLEVSLSFVCYFLCVRVDTFGDVGLELCISYCSASPVRQPHCSSDCVLVVVLVQCGDRTLVRIVYL